jgi:putative FmdB family regulatory protein
MPTYEYACRDCGAHVEVVQRFDEEPLRTCARCGGELRKVFHPAGIVFKGSGFYATDSRKAPAKEGTPSGDGKAASGSGGKKASTGAADGGTSGSSGATKEKSA